MSEDQVQNPQDEELSEDELDDVAGGVGDLRTRGDETTSSGGSSGSGGSGGTGGGSGDGGTAEDLSV